MMRSLWTAASGMNSQQLNVDTISNNLANVNTYGYKTERAEFKSLLYDTMQRADLDPANQGNRVVNLQVGSGVRPVGVSRMFTPGSIQRTEQAMDFAIQGNGFFAIQKDENTIAYTKDGAFKLSPVDEGLMMVTTEGYPLLSIDDEPIIIPREISARDVTVDDIGRVMYMQTDRTQVDSGFQVDIVQFPNVQGLEAVGQNLFLPTPAAGAPMKEVDGDVSTYSTISQGALELSNVQVANEMVNLIVAQRAYELNSKAIQTSDDMLSQANNLKR